MQAHSTMNTHEHTSTHSQNTPTHTFPGHTPKHMPRIHPTYMYTHIHTSHSTTKSMTCIYKWYYRCLYQQLTYKQSPLNRNTISSLTCSHCCVSDIQNQTTGMLPHTAQTPQLWPLPDSLPSSANYVHWTAGPPTTGAYNLRCGIQLLPRVLIWVVWAL